MAEDKEPESNRPEDSAFKQQRLKAWQPILTPAWVIGTFLSVGCVFIAIGIAVLIASNDVVEQSTGDYSDEAFDSSIYSGHTTCTQGADTDGGSCLKEVSMKIEKDMDAPVYMYFELSNFYQNHRRYVKSRSDAQLMSNGDRTTTDQCSPIDKYTSAGGDEVPVYPCGLIAWSAFNDTVYAADTVASNTYYYQDRLLVMDSDATVCDSTNCNFVTTTKDGIAWSSDKDDKFDAITPTQCNGNAMVNTGITDNQITMPYDTFKYYSCSSGSGYADYDTSTGICSIGSTDAASTSCFDSTPTNSAYGTSAGTTKTTCAQADRCGYIGNEEFIVWMRTSGLPTFRKLYRVINTDLKEGQTIKFTVNDVFPVSKFSGTKKIVLSTTTWIGGKNTFLGAAYITVACICILLGIGFAIKEAVGNEKKE